MEITILSKRGKRKQYSHIGMRFEPWTSRLKISKWAIPLQHLVEWKCVCVCLWVIALDAILCNYFSSFESLWCPYIFIESSSSYRVRCSSEVEHIYSSFIVTFRHPLTHLPWPFIQKFVTKYRDWSQSLTRFSRVGEKAINIPRDWNPTIIPCAWRRR